METTFKETALCQVCNKQKKLTKLLPAELVKNSLLETISKHKPTWSSEQFICLSCLNHFRSLHVQELLESEHGYLSNLDKDVIESLEDQDLLSLSTTPDSQQPLSFGELLSDRIAEFGGSWLFIISFSLILIGWVVTNSFLLYKAFDPYPYILLNLGLSGLAALQAPIIMMSQNRQAAKDRYRAELDYRINLKAEIEVRHISDKLDYLLNHQWQKLMQIQQVQMEIMSNKKTKLRTYPKNQNAVKSKG